MADVRTNAKNSISQQDSGILVAAEADELPDLLALKAAIIERAHELGFDLVRFTRAETLPGVQEVLEERIDAGLLSGLTWFTKERARVASDPRNLMASARTAVSLGISYLVSGEYTPSVPGEARGKVARYAWGLDYHEVFKSKLTALHAFVQEKLGRDVEARTLVDSARITDRAVAERAGMGWYGKNSNILNRERGSWILLGELLLDVDLPGDEPVKTNCGSCTRCMPACPTGAIIASGVINSDRCISYLTIELKGPMPRDMRPLIGDWVFGCDICQEVCPVNRKAVPGEHVEFMPQAGIGASPVLTELLDMTEEEFRAKFKYSPVKRTKWVGLRRNAAVALGNVGDVAGVPALVRALHGESALVRGHAAWALGKIGGAEALLALRERMETEDDEWVREEIGLALEMLAEKRNG